MAHECGATSMNMKDNHLALEKYRACKPWVCRDAGVETCSFGMLKIISALPAHGSNALVLLSLGVVNQNLLEV